MLLGAILMQGSPAVAKDYPVLCGDISKRPSPESFTQFIVKSPSMVSERFRVQAVLLIKQMDEVNGKLLHVKDNYDEPEDICAWVYQQKLFLPAKTPQAELALLGYLSLQECMLSLITLERFPEKAHDLNEAQTKHRIHPKTDRVFGDARDVFLADLLDIMGRIARLQEYLGVTGKWDQAFPSHLQTLAEVEDFVLDKLKTILKRSRRIRDIKLKQ